MKLVQKLATLARSLARRSTPRQGRTVQPLSNKAPPRLAKERAPGSEHNLEEPLEQARVADLLQDKAHSPSTESGKNEKENSDE